MIEVISFLSSVSARNGLDLLVLDSRGRSWRPVHVGTVVNLFLFRQVRAPKSDPDLDWQAAYEVKTTTTTDIQSQRFGQKFSSDGTLVTSLTAGRKRAFWKRAGAS